MFGAVCAEVYGYGGALAEAKKKGCKRCGGTGSIRKLRTNERGYAKEAYYFPCPDCRPQLVPKLVEEPGVRERRLKWLAKLDEVRAVRR